MATVLALPSTAAKKRDANLFIITFLLAVHCISKIRQQALVRNFVSTAVSGATFLPIFLCSSTIYETFRILVQGSFQTVFWVFWVDLLRMKMFGGKLREEGGFWGNVEGTSRQIRRDSLLC
jgi:hypothetical protein